MGLLRDIGIIGLGGDPKAKELRAKAQKGDAKAMLELCNFLRRSTKIKDHDEADEWIKKAVFEQWYSPAMDEYESYNLFNNEAWEKYISQLTAAAEKGSLPAQIRLGDFYKIIYQKGSTDVSVRLKHQFKEMPENREQAIKWYTMAIETKKDNPQNAVIMGYLNELGYTKYSDAEVFQAKIALVESGQATNKLVMEVCKTIARTDWEKAIQLAKNYGHRNDWLTILAILCCSATLDNYEKLIEFIQNSSEINNAEKVLYYKRLAYSVSKKNFFLGLHITKQYCKDEDYIRMLSTKVYEYKADFETIDSVRRLGIGPIKGYYTKMCEHFGMETFLYAPLLLRKSDNSNFIFALPSLLRTYDNKIWEKVDSTDVYVEYAQKESGERKKIIEVYYDRDPSFKGKVAFLTNAGEFWLTSDSENFSEESVRHSSKEEFIELPNGLLAKYPHQIFLHNMPGNEHAGGRLESIGGNKYTHPLYREHGIDECLVKSSALSFKFDLYSSKTHHFMDYVNDYEIEPDDEWYEKYPVRNYEYAYAKDIDQ